MSERWRYSQLAWEAWRNATARGSRLRLLVCLAVALGSLQAAVGIYEYAALSAEMSKSVQRGRGIYYLESQDPGAGVEISKDSCAALAPAHRAGLLLTQPRADLPPVVRDAAIYAADSRLIPHLSGGGNIVLAGQKLLPPTAQKATAIWNGAKVEMRPMPAHPEGLPGATAVVVPLGAVQSGNRCAVLLNPWHDPAAAGLYLSAQLRATGSGLGARDYADAKITSQVHYLQRISRFLPLLLGALGALGAVAEAILTRARAAELAAYRFAGTTGIQLRWLLWGEQILAATAMFLSACLALGIAAFFVPVLPAAPSWAALSGLVWIVLAPAGVPALRNPAGLAKER